MKSNYTEKIRHPSQCLIRHDNGAGGSEHAAYAVADRDLGAGDLRRSGARIWRTLSCREYMPSARKRGRRRLCSKAICAWCSVMPAMWCRPRRAAMDHCHPRESGGPGGGWHPWLWIPAFAGMTGGADHEGSRHSRQCRGVAQPPVRCQGQALREGAGALGATNAPPQSVTRFHERRPRPTPVARQLILSFPRTREPRASGPRRSPLGPRFREGDQRPV
jgi:hypothetical protein